MHCLAVKDICTRANLDDIVVTLIPSANANPCDDIGARKRMKSPIE